MSTNKTFHKKTVIVTGVSNGTSKTIAGSTVNSNVISQVFENSKVSQKRIDASFIVPRKFLTTIRKTA